MQPFDGITDGASNSQKPRAAAIDWRLQAVATTALCLAFLFLCYWRLIRPHVSPLPEPPVQMPVIPAFVLNLDRRADRLQNISRALHQQAPWLFPRTCRVSAPNGRAFGEHLKESLVPEWLWRLALERDRKQMATLGGPLTKGAVALIVGHARMWEHLVQSKAPWGIFMEDDLMFFHPGLEALFGHLGNSQLPAPGKDWDYLQIQGGDCPQQSRPPLHILAGTGYNTGMYILTIEAAKRAIQAHFPMVNEQLDNPENFLRSQCRGHRVCPAAAQQHGSLVDSDVQIPPKAAILNEEPVIPDCPMLTKSEMLQRKLFFVLLVLFWCVYLLLSLALDMGEMAGSPTQRPRHAGGHVASVSSGTEEKDCTMPPNTASAERRQKRLRRLRAEKEDLLAALRTSRLRVKQLEAARVLFATPTAEVDVADLSLSAASSPSESGHVQPPCCPLPKVPVGAQSLSQCRELRQVMQSHQETLEQEGFMWQAILDQQEEDAKQIRERVAEAEEMHDQMEARVQGLMDLMVALLSPASAPEGQEELLSSKYLAMVEDLDFHQDRVEAKVSSLHAALEVERSENCGRALQLCDQQRRTTRLHDDLCRLQGHLFHTRQGNRKQEPPTVAHRTGEFFLPDAVTHELPKDGYLDVSVHALPSVATPATVTPVTECSAGMEAQEDPDGGNPTDTNFPDTASPEPLSPAAPAVTPSLPEEPGSCAERAQIEAAMRDVLEEVAFDHLVVRCNGFYEFGKMARACLRLSDGVLTASVDGVIYEPFEEFLSKLQEPAASLRAARREDCPKASQVAAPREAEPRKPPPSPGSSAGPERGSGRAEAAANGTRGGAPAKLSRGASPSQGRRLKVDRRGSAAAEKAAPTSGHVPSSSSRPSQVAGATRAQQPRPKTGTPRAGSKENTTSKPTGASRGGDLPCSKVDKRGSLASTPPRAKAGNSTAGGSDGTPLSRATSSAAGSGIVSTGPGGTTSAAVPVPLPSPGSELRGELRSPGGLCKSVLMNLHPNLQVEEPVLGTCVNGKRRSPQQASWDWTMGDRKVECKSCRLSWQVSTQTWCINFVAVKLAEPGIRTHALFDDLYLVVDRPDAVHILKHDLRTGLSRSGAATAVRGHRIVVRGSRDVREWRSAWSTILQKLCEGRGGCETIEEIPLTDPRLLSAVCKAKEDSVYRRHGCDPLSDLSPCARGKYVEQMGFEIDQKLNSTSTFVRPRSLDPVDWIRDSVRVELKHAKMVKMKAPLWRCCFSNIKCAADEVRQTNAFDELWLALYSPLGIDFFGSCGQLRYTSVGVRGPALGRDLDLRVSSRHKDVFEALCAFRRQLEQAGCHFTASVRWLPEPVHPHGRGFATACNCCGGNATDDASVDAANSGRSPIVYPVADVGNTQTGGLSCNGTLPPWPAVCPGLRCAAASSTRRLADYTRGPGPGPASQNSGDSATAPRGRRGSPPSPGSRVPKLALPAAACGHGTSTRSNGAACDQAYPGSSAPVYLCQPSGTPWPCCLCLATASGSAHTYASLGHEVMPPGPLCRWAVSRTDPRLVYIDRSRRG
eukprot:s375_g9.t3